VPESGAAACQPPGTACEGWSSTPPPTPHHHQPTIDLCSPTHTCGMPDVRRLLTQKAVMQKSEMNQQIAHSKNISFMLLSNGLC